MYAPKKEASRADSAAGVVGVGVVSGEEVEESGKDARRSSERTKVLRQKLQRVPDTDRRPSGTAACEGETPVRRVAEPQC